MLYSVSESSDFAATAEVQFADTNGATTNVNSQSRLSNISRTTLALDVVNDQQSPTPTVNNGLVVAEPCRPRARQDETVTLNETDDVLPNTKQADDDLAWQKKREDTALVRGTPVTVIVSQNRASASHFERQVNGCDGVQGASADRPAVASDARNNRESYVSEARLERPVTSYNVTSSHVTSGCGRRRPISVNDTPMTSRVTAIPVRVGRSSQSVMTGARSVDQSRETLRTDSTRATVMPHKTTSSRTVSTTGPQDETVQPASNAERRRPAAPPGGSTPCTTDHSVSSQLEPVDVVVTKSGLALGFSIDGGKDSVIGDRPVTVKKVYRGKRRLL